MVDQDAPQPRMPDQAETAEAIEQAADAIAKELKKAAGDAALRLGTRLIRHGGQILRGRRLRAQGFEERLYSRWAYPLDMYELCLYLAHQCGDYFIHHFGARAVEVQDNKYAALTRLHAGAVRVAGEIYTLLLSGFASGAHARWRTLHEIATVALLISNQPDEVAERYLHHQFVKSYEDAQHYQKHAARLNRRPFSDDEMASIQRNYDAVLRRFGDDFRESYGWARPALETLNPKLKGQKLGFQQVQEVVQAEHWTPDYRMASHAVHPSATFLRFTLGTRDGVPTLLAGPSNADLADPGQNALFALSNATAALMTYRPKGNDDETNESTLKDWEPVLVVMAMNLTLDAFTKTASKAFFEVHQQLESEMQSDAAIVEPGSVNGESGGE